MTGEPIPPLPDLARLDRLFRVVLVLFVAAMTALIAVGVREGNWSAVLGNASVVIAWSFVIFSRRRWLADGRIRGRLEMSRSALQAQAEGADMKDWLLIEMARTAHDLKLTPPDRRQP